MSTPFPLLFASADTHLGNSELLGLEVEEINAGPTKAQGDIADPGLRAERLLVSGLFPRAGDSKREAKT